MYADTDPETRFSVPYAQFAADNQQAIRTAAVSSAQVLPGVRSVGADELVPVLVHSSAFGSFTARFVLPIEPGGATPAILWNTALVFPGLHPGETLSAHLTLPQRGQLLARDYVKLSDIPAAANVVGSVQPATGSQNAALIGAGFPSGTPVGVDGLQYLFQSQLAGKPGGELFAGHRVLARAPARSGKDVVTSIDPELQTLANSEFGTHVGGIVVMAPATGELLAVAGNPLSIVQPPGSTFKIITSTAALEDGLATLNTTYPDTTAAVIDGYSLGNSQGEDCGGTLANAFAVSCNSVFAPLGVRIGTHRLVQAANAYGFNAPSPLPIAQESSIPLAADELETGESAIGQWQVLASPLQMSIVAATIALVGRKPVPTFDVDIHRLFPRVVPIPVAQGIRTMMLDVVRDGTGIYAQIPGVEVAGKTGTAQVATQCKYPDGATGEAGPQSSGATGSTGSTSSSCSEGNDPYDTDAWFVSFAPAYDPRIVVAVLLDHDGMGGATAAPIARESDQRTRTDAHR